jgi:hypothetical protein
MFPVANPSQMTSRSDSKGKGKVQADAIDVDDPTQAMEVEQSNGLMRRVSSSAGLRAIKESDCALTSIGKLRGTLKKGKHKSPFPIRSSWKDNVLNLVDRFDRNPGAPHIRRDCGFDKMPFLGTTYHETVYYQSLYVCVRPFFASALSD